MNFKQLQFARWREVALIGAAWIVFVELASAFQPAPPPPSDLWTINADGTGLKRFADTTGYTCGSPEWSPDGKCVVYCKWRNDQNLYDAHLVVSKSDGTDARDLGIGAMPNWSPDGKMLVCHTYATSRNKTDQIVVMNADGTGREAILDHWGCPRWSRRGNRVVSILNHTNLALFDLATGAEHVILPVPYPVNLGFGVSPEGTRFCFSGRDRGLYLATLTEKTMMATVRPLLTSGKCQYVSFAPDSKRIVFSYFPKGYLVSQLYVMDVDAVSEPQRLAGQDATRHNWGPNWSPDGKTIIFVSKDAPNRKTKGKPAQQTAL